MSERARAGPAGALRPLATTITPANSVARELRRHDDTPHPHKHLRTVLHTHARMPVRACVRHAALHVVCTPLRAPHGLVDAPTVCVLCWLDGAIPLHPAIRCDRAGLRCVLQALCNETVAWKNMMSRYPLVAGAGDEEEESSDNKTKSSEKKEVRPLTVDNQKRAMFSRPTIAILK